MKRVLIGMAILVSVGTGFFGVRSYAQLAATSEVDALFERIRATGAKASHGNVTFDAASRNLTIEDITIEPPQTTGPSMQASVRIARVKATGVSAFTQDQFTADSVDVGDVEVTADAAQDTVSFKFSYKVPAIALQHFSGPLRFAALPEKTTPIELYHHALEQFTSFSASSLTIPSFSGNGIASGMFNVPKAASTSQANFSLSGSGISYQNIRQGKIAEAKLDHVKFAVDVPELVAGESPIKETGDIANVEARDIDLTAITALFDPAASRDETFHQLYGHVSVGPYSITATSAPDVTVAITITKASIDGMALQPSNASQLLALATIDPKAPRDPQKDKELVAKVTAFYQGVRVGKAEAAGMSFDSSLGSGKLNAVRFDDNELAIEGLDAPAPDGKGRFAMERFAIKAFRPGKMMAVLAAVAASGPDALNNTEQMLGFLQVLSGFEFKGITMPYKKTGKILTIGGVSANWGQYVGVIPTKLDLAIKANVPADPSDPNQIPFINAGIAQINSDTSLNLAWSENTKSFNVTLNSLTDKISETKAQVTLANVSRGVFTTDVAQAMTEAKDIETGTVDLALKDTGLTDLLAAILQSGQNISTADARQMMVDTVKTLGTTATSPDAAAVTSALVGLVQNSGQTITIKLTPKGKVPALGLVDLVKDDPVSALAMFQVEAATHK